MKIFELTEEAGKASVSPATSARDHAAERGDFEVFPKLPIEIRLMIWGIAPEGRTIEVRFDQENGTYTYILVADSPPILRACKESRREGLTTYRHFFHSPLARNTTFFNPGIDTLYMTTHSTPAQSHHFKLSNMQDLKLVERILLPLSHFAPTFELWGSGSSVLRAHIPFKNLKSITLLDNRNPPAGSCAKTHDDRVCVAAYEEELPNVLGLDAARVNVANMKLILEDWERETGGLWKMPAIHYGKLCGEGISGGAAYA